MTVLHGQAFRPPAVTGAAAPYHQTVPRWAVICAALSPVLLTGAYLVAGMLQPSSYDPIRQTISAMAGYTATDRWIMNGGIILVGACYLVTATGLTALRPAARVLLAIAGVAGLGIAASPESASGPSPQHLAWAVLGALIITIWPACAARRAAFLPPVMTTSGAAVVTIVFAGLLSWLFIETRDGSVLGLAERLTTSVQTCWPAVVAVSLHRTRARTGPARRIRSPGIGDGQSPSRLAAWPRTGKLASKGRSSCLPTYRILRLRSQRGAPRPPHPPHRHQGGWA